MMEESARQMTINNELTRYIAGEILKDSTRVVMNDEPLISSGLIDSFSLVDLALYVEDTFGVRIEDTELTSAVFDTVEQLVELISRRRAGEAG
jgi:acyl carrier protein